MKQIRVKIFFLLYLKQIKHLAQMTAITLKNLPDEIHLKVKMIQLQLEMKGQKKRLEDIYLELINEAVKNREKETPTK